MKALPLTATVIAAALLLGIRPSAAADLDYGYVPPSDRFGAAYEDPRYRDLYAPEPPRVYRFEPRPYAEAHPVPPGYVYRERERERVAEWGRADDWRSARGCLPQREIKRRLLDDGWHDFHDIDVTRNSAHVKARRPNGEIFQLEVDRCNGAVVRADLISRAGIGPYASRLEPRRYERPYY